jgi:hypothetical protein
MMEQGRVPWWGSTSSIREDYAYPMGFTIYIEDYTIRMNSLKMFEYNYNYFKKSLSKEFISCYDIS